VPGLRRDGHEGPLAQAEKIVSTHQAQEALGIDAETFLAELHADSSVSVETILERNALDGIAHNRLFLAWSRSTPVAVVAGAAEPSQRTQPRHAEFALRQRLRHRFDDGVEVLDPRPSVVARPASTCRKACRKKSSSTCC
jgi:hypothetical protein